jgi:Aspartyl protease
MPQLTFPIAPAGLNVDVRINLDGTTLTALHAAGRPAPASIPATGLIDTGSDVTALTSSIIQQLSVPVHYHATTQGIGGTVPVRLFLVTLFILDSRQLNLPWLVRPDLMVMELPAGFPVEVLIGMDVMRSCKTLIDGPAGQFTLEF